MTSIDQLPPERSLPPDRQERLRAEVLSAMTTRAPRHRRPGTLAAAGLAVVACAAIVWVGVSGYLNADDRKPEVYALGDSVLSFQARQAGRKCLELARDLARDERARRDSRPEESPPILLNYLEQPGQKAVVVYEVQPSMLVPCLMGPAYRDEPEPRRPHQDGFLSAGLAIYEATAWLPGPISIEGATASDTNGGYVMLAGRVSERVAQVVLDDSAGHRSTARLAEGTFVVISDGRIATDAGVLISYDADGKEIDRRKILQPLSGHCYTDPAGNLVNPTSDHEIELAFKSNPDRCEPAERWSRRTATQPVPR